eukprot:sb/3474658/
MVMDLVASPYNKRKETPLTSTPKGHTHRGGGEGELYETMVTPHRSGSDLYGTVDAQIRQGAVTPCKESLDSVAMSTQNDLTTQISSVDGSSTTSNNWSSVPTSPQLLSPGVEGLTSPASPKLTSPPDTEDPIEVS